MNNRQAQAYESTRLLPAITSVTSDDD